MPLRCRAPPPPPGAAATGRSGDTAPYELGTNALLTLWTMLHLEALVEGHFRCRGRLMQTECSVGSFGGHKGQMVFSQLR